MEGYLHKKESGNYWVEYWSLLQGHLLKFESRRRSQSEDVDEKGTLIGWIEITPETKCILGKKKSYGYTFYIEKIRKRYLFKTNDREMRKKWIDAIDTAIRNFSIETSSTAVGVNEEKNNGSNKEQILVQDFILELASRTAERKDSVASDTSKQDEDKDNEVFTDNENKENYEKEETYKGDDLCNRMWSTSSDDSQISGCCCCESYEGDDLCDLSGQCIMSSENKLIDKVLPKHLNVTKNKGNVLDRLLETSGVCMCTLDSIEVSDIKKIDEKKRRRMNSSLSSRESHEDETFRLL